MAQEYNFKDKVILVTGCASGIGLSIVAELLSKNCIKGLFLLDIKETEGEKLEEKISTEHRDVKVKFRKCDVGVDSEVVAAYYEGWQYFGYIDAVINNAGIVNEDQWRRVIKVNQWGVIESTYQAWNRMRADRGGRGGTIINVSSCAAFLPQASVPVYSATKAAIKNFSESLGDLLHFNRTGVRVLTVCPSLTDTPILLESHRVTLDDESNKSIMEEIAEAKMFSSKEVAISILEVYRTAPSGTSWVVTDKIEKISMLPSLKSS